MSALCECGAPATTGNYCTGDLAKLQARLHHTPDVIKDLDVTITGQDAQGGQGDGGGTPDAFNERASDARDALSMALREAAYAADPKGQGKTPAAHAAMALGGLANLARNSRAHAIDEALRNALKEADHVRDRVEEKVSYGPCTCGVEIVAPRSKDTAWCRGCHEEYDLRAVRAWKYVNALERVESYRGRIADVANVLKNAGHQVRTGTLYEWKRRGKLIPDDDGLFSTKKVLELLHVH